MKKIVALLSIVVALTACNGEGTSTEVKNDSSAVSVDSVKVDSTAVVVDSAAAKVEEVK